MFLTTVTDIMPMDTTMARGPLMPSPRLRLSMAIMDTLTVWDTTLVMLAMLATPTPMAMESPPPTPPLDTLWPTLLAESPTPPTSESAPTTSEPSSPARQSVSSTVSTSSS